jgi:haloacid dehalogenase-like hydrolase
VSTRALRSLLVSLSLSTLSAGCAGPHHLDGRLAWAGKNRARIDSMLDALGKRAASWDASRKPVATFDWDNTCIRNDAGDATMYWMLRNDKVLQPPGKDWRRTSPFLTGDGVAALAAACGGLAEAGRPLPTSRDAACATELVTLYGDGRTVAGKEAFAGFNHRRMEPAYAWGAALEAGYTPDEVRGFAEAARAENLAAPVGATQTVGNRRDLAGYIRYYDQIRDLIGALQANGFDVWIVSASSQFVAEVFAAGVGVARDHVIGIRSLLGGDGRVGYDLQGCGDVPDGANGIITYIDGKRCWINKGIFGDGTAAALSRGERRQVFTAGDSDTDITFLRDASALRLVIDRHRSEVMCYAHNNEDGNWLINPMFFDPLPPAAAPYPCASAACKDENSRPGPCTDDRGNVIPDQPAARAAQ